MNLALQETYGNNLVPYKDTEKSWSLYFLWGIQHKTSSKSQSQIVSHVPASEIYIMHIFFYRNAVENVRKGQGEEQGGVGGRSCHCHQQTRLISFYVTIYSDIE